MSNTTYDLGRVGLNLRGGYKPHHRLRTPRRRGLARGQLCCQGKLHRRSPWGYGQVAAPRTGAPAHSTQEQATGSLWLNGKPIYAKTLMFATPQPQMRP